MSKDDPLSVDLRMFPERPATMNTPEPERLSEDAVVLSLVVAVVSVEPEVFVESSLLAQEMIVEDKPAINQVYKKNFINFLKINNKE